MRIDRVMTSVVTAALSGAASASAQPDYRYAWIDLPGLIEVPQYAGVGGINALGAIAGGAASGPGTYDLAAVWWNREGGVSALKSLGGTYSGAGGITDSGDLIWGTSVYANGSPLRPRAVVWRNGEIEDIGSLGGEITDFVSPQGMNNLGQVVGQSDNELAEREAFVWENGAMRPLPNLGDRRGVAYSINDAGDITGGLTDDVYSSRPVLWRSGTDIVLLPFWNDSSGTPAFPLAINDDGVIVGSAETRNRDTHAAAWVDGRIFDIHTPGLGSSFSVASDINNHDQIVGDVGLLSSRGFIRNPGAQMILLDDLVPPRIRLNRYIERGRRINDAGQITAHARKPGSASERWAVLLTPVDPTMELAAPSPGRAGTSNTLTVTAVTPGARVTFLYSRHGGGTRIPGCDLQQNALQLDNPTVVGSTVANENGVATITRTVPLIARGRTFLFQAVVQGSVRSASWWCKRSTERLPICDGGGRDGLEKVCSDSGGSQRGVWHPAGRSAGRALRALRASGAQSG